LPLSQGARGFSLWNALAPLGVHKVGVSSGITVAVHLFLQVPGHLAPWPGAQCAG
jgi:hypothetical protein